MLNKVGFMPVQAQKVSFGNNKESEQTLEAQAANALRISLWACPGMGQPNISNTIKGYCRTLPDEGMMDIGKFKLELYKQV